IGLQTKSVMAEENNYESNGQASFYGTYVYENEKESNDVAYTQQSEEQGRNNLAASGQAVLPKTGESENPLYSLIGVSLLGVVIYLINKMKREKELI
ncbi:TPA: LPXTG cell wall anchor domain-containing protein, partial [Enterococcus faecalis]|nr:LPXTG cell wall anchor domain-containing protein [Enterococcus faecalis]